MLLSPQTIHSRITIAAVIATSGLCPQLWCSANAQIFTTQYEGSVPLGLRGVLPTGEGTQFSPGPAGGFKGVFGYGVGLRSIYDSNFFLSKSNPKSEFTTNILPWIRYCSDPEGGAPFSMTASYQPNIRAYLNNPDLDGIDHSGGVTMKVQGAKTMISAAVNYNTVSGTDRLSGTFVTGSLLQAGISGTYQIAPRTSLFANWKLAISDYGSGSLVGSNRHTSEIGAFWSATERLSFGPSIAYTVDDSANTGTRDAWALSMQARYRAAEKLQFTGSLGLQYAANSRDQGASTLGLTGGFSASYAISERLRWDNSIRYVTVPSPSEMNYMINNFTVSTALTRQLLRATVSLGLEMNFSDYVEVGTVGSKLGMEDNFSAILSYRRKLLTDRLDFDSSLRYTVNRGQNDWSQLQITAGLQFQF